MTAAAVVVAESLFSGKEVALHWQGGARTIDASLLSAGQAARYSERSCCCWQER